MSLAQNAADLLSVASLARKYPGGGGVDDVSLGVAPGTITGFIGVNGAGKSTTLRCVMGLIQPDAGEISLFGRPANGESRRRIGFLPEERGLFPRDRARNAIAFHARLKGVPRRDALITADRLLDRTGLGARRNARLEELSKGNVQRVQILCALAHAPELLILDEPLSGLDPIAQSEMLALFAEFKAGGGAILFSTHSMTAAEQLCDRIVMLASGRTVFEGSVEEAAKLAPHGAIIVTTDHERLCAAASSLQGQVLPMSRGMAQSERWRVLLPRHTPHPALLRALSEHAVPVLSFAPITANLEGAFWDIAAPSITHASNAPPEMPAPAPAPHEAEPAAKPARGRRAA